MKKTAAIALLVLSTFGIAASTASAATIYDSGYPSWAQQAFEVDGD